MGIFGRLFGFGRNRTETVPVNSTNPRANVAEMEAVLVATPVDINNDVPPIEDGFSTMTEAELLDGIDELLKEEGFQAIHRSNRHSLVQPPQSHEAAKETMKKTARGPRKPRVKKTS